MSNKQDVALGITILKLTGMRKFVEILSPPDKLGFCDVQHGGLVFKCYKDHMIPFNDLAKKILAKK